MTSSLRADFSESSSESSNTSSSETLGRRSIVVSGIIVSVDLAVSLGLTITAVETLSPFGSCVAPCELAGWLQPHSRHLVTSSDLSSGFLPSASSTSSSAVSAPTLEPSSVSSSADSPTSPSALSSI